MNSSSETLPEHSAPHRVQLSRRKGWRKPPNTVVVARPSKWGNPFTVSAAIDSGLAETEREGRAVAVEAFRAWLRGGAGVAGWSPASDAHRLRILAELPELAGKNLACWCPLDQPCHADVLLELANDAVARS